MLLDARQRPSFVGKTELYHQAELTLTCTRYR